MEGFVAEPARAALTAEEATRLFEDLHNRFMRLGEIRARYRAFIIDEAQDNSAQQWRLLGRLWGDRTLPEGREPPDTPWQPTVCCVGDRKQSIYAFRQAQVSGFVDFGRELRLTNVHEMASIPALTRSPTLRRPDAARDPRYVADGGFATAAELPDSRGSAAGAWVRFDTPENDELVSSDKVLERSEGHIELVTNYRTAGNLLRRMNGWWEDLFSEDHDRFPGDWYARPQRLVPSREQAVGSFEWLLPARVEHEGHPDPDLANPLDPFRSGTTPEMENALIAARIRALLDGAPTRVGEHELEPFDRLMPADILVLLPSRSNLPDLMTRLEAAGIPAEADKAGGLLLRPVIRPLLGLLQWIARPSSRHAAATVARSCLVGANDGDLQTLLGEAELGDDLIQRLDNLLPPGPLANLVGRWNHHSARGSVLAALHATLDHSDLLLAHPSSSERSDAEQFLRLIEAQSAEVGGDAILLADRIAHLAEVAGRDLTSAGATTSDVVQVMTIHGSKGLQARCVIVGGLFSEGQGNIRHDQRDRVLATPGIFAANPRPWLTEASLESGVWTVTRMLAEAQVQAEARRLFYVACTRVKDLLILAGGPSDSISEPDGVSLKLRTLTMPTFGHMWFDAMGWQPEEDGRHRIIPPTLDFAVYRHTSELGPSHPGHSPLVRMTRLDAASQLAFDEVEPPALDTGPVRTRRLAMAPHALDAAAACPRRHWLSTRAGLMPEAIRLDMAGEHPADSAAARVGLPPANVIGSIVHRLVEVGLANPGCVNPTVPLPPQWTDASPDLLADEDVIHSVLTELMPAEADADEVASLMGRMASNIRNGPLGILTSGGTWNGETVEGLRTEWPFSVRHSITIDAADRAWSPNGAQLLASIAAFEISFNGIADLVLCTRLESGEGAIRAIDLKTTGAAHLHANWAHPLLEAEGEDRHPSEVELLQDYRMQLALYTLALQRQEQAREADGRDSRTVLPPAILSTATGRLIAMTPEEMTAALQDLENLFVTLAELALRDEEAEAPPRLAGAAASACDHCPFAMGDIRLCAPEGEPLGLRQRQEPT
jgi:superfamily I DNA/RNA helicase